MMRRNTKEPLKLSVELIMNGIVSVILTVTPSLEPCNGIVQSDDGMSANGVAAHRTIIEPPYGARKYEIVHLYLILIVL